MCKKINAPWGLDLIAIIAYGVCVIAAVYLNNNTNIDRGLLVLSLSLILFVIGSLYGARLAKASKTFGLSKFQLWSIAAFVFPIFGIFLFFGLTFAL